MIMRKGTKVVSSHVARISSARRMPLWEQIQRADRATAKELAKNLPLDEQLRASVARERKPVMNEAQSQLARETSAQLARVQQPATLAPVLPEEKYQLLRDTYAKGCTDSEFQLFVDVCNRLRLDPFAKQIYCIKRWNSQLGREEMQPQPSIDGARLQAQRTGEYRGQDAPQWCGPDGVWKDVWLSKQPPSAARVAVYREGHTKPLTGVALYTEYVQTKKGGDPTQFWRTMPANQLAKCAEALALRKAFPNELSGVYTVDEMGQADNEPAVVSAPPRAAIAATTTTSSGGAAAPVSKPAVRFTEPTQPAPAQHQGPNFAVSFPIKEWSGKPMSSAPAETLRDYIAWCEGVLGDRSRVRLHRNAQASLQQAEAQYEKIVVAEMDRVRAAADAQPHEEEKTTEIGVDVINAAMDAEYARTHGGLHDDDDGNPLADSWNR